MVLSNRGFYNAWSYILVYLKEFAEDIRTWSDDDKQKPNGALIRKQFIVFPVEAPLSPDPSEWVLVSQRDGSGVKWCIA